MNERDFVTWLRGVMEISDEPPTKEQWDKIRKKLDSVTDTHIPVNPPRRDDWWKPQDDWWVNPPYKKYWWEEPYWRWTPHNQPVTLQEKTTFYVGGSDANS